MSRKIQSRTPRQTETIRRMVVTGMLAAITVLLTFTPIGMITLPPPMPAVTLVHLPVMLAALIEGPWVGVPVGLVFGISSFIRAWESGAIGLTLFFRNPLISILPRMLIPLAAWGFYSVWRKLVKQTAASDKVGIALSSIAGALTNTVLCLGGIALLYSSELTELVNNLIALGGTNATYGSHAGAWLVAAVGLPNGLAEALVAALVIPAIKTAVDAVLHRNKRKRSTAVQPQTSDAKSNLQSPTDSAAGKHAD